MAKWDALTKLLTEGGMPHRRTQQVRWALLAGGEGCPPPEQVAAAIINLLNKRVADARQGTLAFFSKKMEEAADSGVLIDREHPESLDPPPDVR